MSELPEGWVETDLGSTTSKIGSGATPRGGHVSYSDAGVPLIRSMNVHFDGVRLKGLVHLDGGQAKALANAEVQNGDVLLNITGASIGRVAVAPPELAGARVNQHVAIIRMMEGVEPHFVRAYLASPDVQTLIGGENYGVTRPALTKGLIEKMGLPLPPLAEQRRIVAKLDALTARTARARADLDRIPTLAARFKQAVLTKAFGGELTANWRTSNRQAAMTSAEQDQARKLTWTSLSKRRGKYEIAEVADWKPDLDLPETWRWASVDELTALVQYGSSAKTSDDVAVPVLRMGNIVEGVLDLAKLKYLPEDHDEFPDLLLDDGDLLFNRTNSAELVGKTAVFRGMAGSTSFASYLIRLKAVGYHPELLASYINSSYGRSWVATATSQQVGQANVNGTKLRGLGVPLMPADEQLVIWQRIKSAFVEIDRLTAEASAARRLLDRLNQAILAKAFLGELVPQDPADEPASVLLDCIRAERASAPKATRGRRKAAA